MPFPRSSRAGFPPLQAEAGWGDAAVVVPWVLYERHGDAGLLADQWDSMTAWLDAFEGRAGAELDFPDGGFMFGDWLDTAAPPDNPARRADAVAVRGHRLPRPLGANRGAGRRRCSAGTAARFADLAERAAERFRAEYVTPTGRLAYPSQTAYALALELDLLAPEQRAHAGRLLAEQVLRRRLPHRHRVPRHAVRHRRAGQRRRAGHRPTSCCCSGRTRRGSTR